MRAFATGPVFKGDRTLIPADQLQAEYLAGIAEENEFWKSAVIDAELIVELPIWMMIEDGEIEVDYGKTKLTVRVDQNFLAVYDGPVFLGSQANICWIGHQKQLPKDGLGEGVPCPVYRELKTVLIVPVRNRCQDDLPQAEGWTRQQSQGPKADQHSARVLGRSRRDRNRCGTADGFGAAHDGCPGNADQDSGRQSMQAQFVHDGKAVDFTPTVDVAVGSIVIQGDLVGITKRDIKAGSLGSIAVEGVFDIPKDPALAIEFEAGTKVYVDEDGAVVADDVGTKYLGKVVTDAAATDSFVRVRLSQ